MHTNLDKQQSRYASSHMQAAIMDRQGAWDGHKTSPGTS